MQFASMHSHKHTPAPRWLNCALMHLQSQIQPLMAPTCINASLHPQNALNQLKSSALLTHSKCTQPTQIKCSPYTLRMHSTNSNQVLSLHTQNALNQLKSRLIMLECGHMHIQCFEIPPKSTNPALVHFQTRDGLQNLEPPPKLFKTPPRLQKHLQQCKNYTSNTQTIKILSMHISNQTSNDSICMSGPITC
jgi:hypothetical protein